MEHDYDTNRDNKNNEEESSIRFPLKEGKVMGLPTDPASVPMEIRLSKKIHKQGNDAMEQTKQSGREWGFFLYFDEVGRLIPGEVKGDYLIILRTKQTDPSREGIGEEAATAYLDLAWNKQTTNLIAGMELKPAIDIAVNEAMIEICKKYNIALYKGEGDKAAKKLE